ncbi:MAG: redoxin family protein [Chloroflexi bacterium]|nr:redoxin family protein [Chloroflexota bacterium]
MPLLQVGDPAPDVGFTGADRKEYKLREYAGKQNVVVAFYARAFTGG